MRYIIPIVIALIILLLIFYISIIQINSYPQLIYNVHKISNSTTNSINNTFRNFEFESNPQHIYYLNANLSNFTYSFNPVSLDNDSIVEMVGILNPINIYQGNMLVDLSTMPNNTYDDDKNAYFGELVYLNISTGNIIWFHKFQNDLMDEPIVYNGLVFYGTGSNIVLSQYKMNQVGAINLSTGKVVWNYNFTGEKMPTPVLFDNEIIYTPGFLGTGYLDAYDYNNGTIAWDLNLSSESAMSSPAVLGNNMFFGSRAYNETENLFYSINMDTHKINWFDNFSANMGTQDSSPSIYNNTIITGAVTENGLMNLNYTLYGINASNGVIRWSLNEGSGPFVHNLKLPPTTAYNNVVYSDTPSLGYLYAINISSGKEIWKYNTGPTDANVNIINGYIFIVNREGELFIFNKNGTLYKEVNIGMPYGPDDVIKAGNKVILYSSTGKIVIEPISNFLNLNDTKK